MPEIRIRYEDDSDRMPYEAIAAVVRTAGEQLAVTELEWIRDDDKDEPAEIHYTIDTGTLPDAFRRAETAAATAARRSIIKEH